MTKKISALFALVIGLGAAFLYANRGLTVTVKNVSAEPLTSVVVHITGSSQALGDIRPGESRTVEVSPTGESHVEIEHAEGRLMVDTYFESGYQGSITVEITAGEVVRVQDNVRVGPI